jgi:hypothetical protein
LAVLGEAPIEPYACQDHLRLIADGVALQLTDLGTKVLEPPRYQVAVGEVGGRTGVVDRVGLIGRTEEPQRIARGHHPEGADVELAALREIVSGGDGEQVPIHREPIAVAVGGTGISGKLRIGEAARLPRQVPQPRVFGPHAGALGRGVGKRTVGRIAVELRIAPPAIAYPILYEGIVAEPAHGATNGIEGIEEPIGREGLAAFHLKLLLLRAIFHYKIEHAAKLRAVLQRGRTAHHFHPLQCLHGGANSSFRDSRGHQQQCRSRSGAC